MKFTVDTGGDRRSVEAKNWRHAIRVAWKKKPPKYLGYLTTVSGKTTLYLNSVNAIAIAGYKVKERKNV